MSPITAMALSVFPSPERTSWRRGQPPSRTQPKPASSMPRGVPQPVGVGHAAPPGPGGNRRPAWPRSRQIARQGADQNGDKAQEQLGLPEQDQIPDAAHHAQAGPLRQRAHDQSGGQG